MLKAFLNRSLRFQIVVIIVFVISLPCIVVAWNVFQGSNSRDALMTLQEERLKNMLNYFEELIDKKKIYSLKDNKENLSTVEKEIKEQFELYSRPNKGVKVGIYLPASDKNYMFNNKKEEVGVTPEGNNQASVSQDINKAIEEVIKAGKEKIRYDSYSDIDFLRIYHPVTYNNEVVAVIWDEIALPPNIYRAKKNLIYILPVSTLTLLIGLFLMMLIVKNLNNNVLRIRQGLERMSEDLSYRIDGMGGDIGKISEAINSMAEALEKKEKLEEQLVRAEKLASLGQMISGVAHEIRNPLGIIRGTVQLMEKNFKTVEGLEEYIKIIKEQSDRENRVIQELLDYVRPSKKLLMEMDIKSVINSVLSFTNKYIQDKKVKLNLKLEENLPNLLIDGDKIKQVFVNMIINACEAMEDGGTLTIEAKRENKYINVYFKDTGIGMTEEEVKNIFNPYYTTKAKGTGLGLTISNGIVELHDGAIEVHSKKGEGTTFIIKLPSL